MILIASESAEQAIVIAWAQHAVTRKGFESLACLFAIPNFSGHAGSQTARLIAGAKAKREGRSPGVPDLMLPVARGPWHGCFVEMKRLKRGQVSPAQRGWHARLIDQGYRVETCKGSEAAIDVLTDYLMTPNRPA